ncbi:dnaJ homolog subfamily C member 25 homolog isoform X3 [Ixodes scapularis]
MARAYRQLARKHHPDMHKTQEAKSRATERFTLIATAYEILKDDESRKDYDDMLDNPEAVYRHYFRYYRKRMAPRVDVRIVLAVTITVISVVQVGASLSFPRPRWHTPRNPSQYYGAWHRYRTAIDHLVTVPKYRLKVRLSDNAWKTGPAHIVGGSQAARVAAKWQMRPSPPASVSLVMKRAGGDADASYAAPHESAIDYVCGERRGPRLLGGIGQTPRGPRVARFPLFVQAVEIARADGFYNPSRKRDRRRKEELKDEEESLLRKIIEEQVDIRGGYSRPSLRQVLWVQLVLLPVTLGHLAWWQARWLFKFTLGGQELGPVEKEYLIRRHMGLSQGQWDALEDRERQGFLRDQLWLKDKFKVWKQRQEEEMRAKLAESARYKSYRRYMKNHGPGQISFED